MLRLETLLQDATYALRGLRRAPAFTATVVLTLGLGIGANTAIFGIVDRLMLRPFPGLRDPDRVHRVYTTSTFRDRTRTGSVSQYTTFLDLQKYSTSFEAAAGYFASTLAVGSGADARERRVGAVSASFFSFFDAPPVRGRYFDVSEDVTPVGAPVSVISHAFWQTELGGRDVIGEPLQVWNVRTTIVGVAPPGFVGVFDADPPAVYIPITTYAGNNPNMRDRNEYFTRYNWGWMDMMVRRKSGVTIEQANADLTQANLKSWEAMQAQEPGGTPIAIAKPRAAVGALKAAAGPDPSVEARTVRWVFGIAFIVLLIACSNVANLFLARALRRRRETAVRIALGGGRGRLMVQWFTEALVLALIGCAAGVLIAQWGGATLRELFVGRGAPIAVATDWRTLGLSVSLAMAAAILTALAPALVMNRTGVASDLKAGVREGTHQRSTLRTGLVVFQVTLSLVLLVGAGLFVRSFANVRSLRLGYDFDQVVLVSRNMRGQVVPDSALVTLQRRMLDAASTLPEVEHVALASSVPFWSTSSTDLRVPGIDSVRRLGQFTYQTASADYFAAMGTRIVRGRGFTPADRGGTERVAIVSDAMARVLWPGEDAIGKQMRVGSDTADFTTVVGIAEDAAQNELTAEDRRFRYYLPLEQYSPTRGSYLLARVRGTPAVTGEVVRKAVQQVMPGETYVTVRPLSEIIEGRQRAWRFGATMFVAFGVLALVVAAIGLYGVIGYDVAQRMHELGVRMALGAQSGDLLRLVLGQGVRVATMGIVLGTLVALAMGSKIEGLLFQQTANDARVIGVVAAILFLAAVIATLVPALRASRADPSVALRSD
ncbi:MAG: ABC transporter permease [Gemmatimonadetes bacterium]|nr:ABC transporter permease [Gemmatimonadota bacterium]